MNEIEKLQAEIDALTATLASTEAALKAARAEADGLRVACSYQRGLTDGEIQRFVAERAARDSERVEASAERTRLRLEIGNLRVDLAQAKLDVRVANLERDTLRHDLATLRAAPQPRGEVTSEAVDTTKDTEKYATQAQTDARVLAGRLLHFAPTFSDMFTALTRSEREKLNQAWSEACKMSETDITKTIRRALGGGA